MLKILLTIALALGMAGQGAFYSHILLNSSSRFLSLILGVGLMFACHHFVLRKSFPHSKTAKGTLQSNTNAWGLAVLAFLAVPLVVEAYHYPLGGWDAWSC